ncbi:hypothetical protein B0H11DRAFT_2353576 [Mycena galericulata]|nr:hypothetical protein B0H11DRAFT_2353576 [Mycena galericulata]
MPLAVDGGPPPLNPHFQDHHPFVPDLDDSLPAEIQAEYLSLAQLDRGFPRHPPPEDTFRGLRARARNLRTAADTEAHDDAIERKYAGRVDLHRALNRKGYAKRDGLVWVKVVLVILVVAVGVLYAQIVQLQHDFEALNIKLEALDVKFEDIYARIAN